jgi:hypothetical protein
MIKFVKRLLIIISITLIFDRIISYGASFLYKTTTTTDAYKLNVVVSKMNDPVVFMGSSRSHHHYIPSIISDSLQVDVYNAGLWGMRNIYFHYALLCNILERYTPQTICLELHPIDYLQLSFSTLENVGKLTPFINYSLGSDDLLKKSGVYYKAQLSHLYRYNSEFANLLLGNMSTRSMTADKGYKKLEGQLNLENGEILPERFPLKIDKEKVFYLQAFIDKCKEKNINLILLYSPMYIVETTNLFDIPDSIARVNDLPFINNYNLEGITGHPEYYYDYGHLNDVGAKKYSSIISNQLKQHLIK